MKVKILGTRGEIEPSAPYHSRKSGLLIDDKLLVDVGEKEFLQERFEAILLTHLHPDHAWFMRRGAKDNLQTDKPAYAPEENKQNNIKKLAEPKTIAGYRITPVPTIHSKKVKSQGYIVEKGGERIFYSGDLIWIKKDYHNLLGELDLIVTEASFMRKQGMIRRDKDGNIFGHAGVPRLVEFFGRFTGHIALMHYGTWFYEDPQKARDRVRDLGSDHFIDLIVGYDGLTIDTGKL